MSWKRFPAFHQWVVVNFCYFPLPGPSSWVLKQELHKGRGWKGLWGSSSPAHLLKQVRLGMQMPLGSL